MRTAYSRSGRSPTTRARVATVAPTTTPSTSTAYRVPSGAGTQLSRTDVLVGSRASTKRSCGGTTGAGAGPGTDDASPIDVAEPASDGADPGPGPAGPPSPVNRNPLSATFQCLSRYVPGFGPVL